MSDQSQAQISPILSPPALADGVSSPEGRALVVLITNCLQVDVFHQFPKRNSPTALNRGWVGRKESERVLGTQSSRGPVAQLFEYIRGGGVMKRKTTGDESIGRLGNITDIAQQQQYPISPPSSSSSAYPLFHVLHLRCCIDPVSNPSHQSLLDTYGPYCIANTEGVQLVCNLEENIALYPNEQILNTTRSLSSRTFGPLKRALRQIQLKSQESRPDAHPLPLRVAVIGAYTEEDIYHICYELRTHTSARDIATCSVLTASPSSSQHWAALSQLHRVMNVTVTRTVRELIDWLALDNSLKRLPTLPTLPISHWPTLVWLNSARSPPPSFSHSIDGELLAHLYKNSTRLSIDVLQGGFSSTLVLSINSVDTAGVSEAASVVKIGQREDIAAEYANCSRVEDILGNNAPTVRGIIEVDTRAAIKFRYGRMSDGKVRRLLDLFDDLATNTNAIIAALDEIYGRIFEPWFSASTSEMFDLFSYYFDGFEVNYGQKISYVHQDPSYLSQFAAYLMAKKGTDEAPHYKKDLNFYSYPPITSPVVTFPHCPPLSNLSLIFAKSSGMPYLRTLPPRRLYSSYAHGDATLQNFLLDARENVWVIDFYFCEPRNHVLRDVSKTFTAIMFVGGHITNDSQFLQAYSISTELAKARDLHSPLPSSLPPLTDPHLLNLYNILVSVWRHVGRMVKERSSAVQFQLALIADCMRFFLYTARNIYAKRWAYVTAVLLSESVLISEKRIHDITPSWLPTQDIPLLTAKLGLSRCPGNKNYLRYERKGKKAKNITKDEQSVPLEPPSLIQSVSLPLLENNSLVAEKGESRALREESERRTVKAKQEQQRILTRHVGESFAPSNLIIDVISKGELTRQTDALHGNDKLYDKNDEKDILTMALRDEETEDELTPHTGSSGKGGFGIIVPLDEKVSESKKAFEGERQHSAPASTTQEQQNALSQLLLSPALTPPNNSDSNTNTHMTRLEKEVSKLSQEGVTHILLLINDAEYKDMGVDKSALFNFTQRHNINSLAISLPAGLMPISLLIHLVSITLPILCSTTPPYPSLVLASKGGFHRAGTLASCFLCAFGLTSDAAIRRVRETRGIAAVGFDERERAVSRFDMAWKKYLMRQVVESGGRWRKEMLKEKERRAKEETQLQASGSDSSTLSGKKESGREKIYTYQWEI